MTCTHWAEDMKNEDAISQSEMSQTKDYPLDGLMAQIAKQFASQEHLEQQISMIFRSIDSDSSGTIDFAELGRYLAKFSAIFHIDHVRLTEDHYEQMTEDFSLCDDNYNLALPGFRRIILNGLKDY